LTAKIEVSVEMVNRCIDCMQKDRDWRAHC